MSRNVLLNLYNLSFNANFNSLLQASNTDVYAFQAMDVFYNWE